MARDTASVQFRSIDFCLDAVDVFRHYDRCNEMSLWHLVTALRAVAFGLRPRACMMIMIMQTVSRSKQVSLFQIRLRDCFIRLFGA
jgi:hypothetical protein